MVIKSFKKSATFRYLWLKKITGVDLSVHCAKCLEGTYNKDIKSSTIELCNYELEDGIWYLCGVAYPFNWANNFHLAFRSCEGSTITSDHHGIKIEIEGAKELPISEEFIPPDNPHINHKSFYTCRNWQFANWLADNLK